MRKPTVDEWDRLRIAEVVTLAATVVAFALTLGSLGSWSVSEANPLARLLLWNLGFMPAGVVAVATVAGIFALYRRVRHRAPRTVLAGGACLVTLSVGDALLSAYVATQVDTTLLTGRILGPIAVTALTATLAAWRPDIRWLIPSNRPRVGATKLALAVVIAGALVMLLPLIAPLQPAAPVGEARAATSLFDGFEDGDASEWTLDCDWGVSSSSSNVYKGSYALHGSDTCSGTTAEYRHSSYSPNQVSWWFKPKTLGTKSDPFYLDDSGATSFFKARLYSNGTVKYNDGTSKYTVATLSTGNWYKMTIENIDWSNTQLDFVIYDTNGNVVGEVTNKDFASSTSSFDEFTYWLSDGDGSEVAIDNYRVGTKPKVSGYVEDANGNALENVTVSTNTSVSTTTSADGSWSMRLSSGTYEITASKDGYVNETKTITVSGDTTGVNFTLSKESTATPDPLPDGRMDYTMGVCYAGDATFQPAGATATWNPYPSDQDNNWNPDVLEGSATSTFGENKTTTKEVYASKNVSYRIGVSTDRASFVFSGVNPHPNNTADQFTINAPFDAWLQTPSDWSCEAGESVPQSPTTTDSFDGLTTQTPFRNGDITVLGTCTVPAANGTKTGLSVQYYDPSYSTESLHYELEYKNVTAVETVRFDEPRGWYYGCSAGGDGIDPGDVGETITFPNGTNGTVAPPSLNGTAELSNGSSISFNETGFGVSGNAINGSGLFASGGALIGPNAGAGAPIWATAVPAVAGLAYVGYRRYTGKGGGSGGGGLPGLGRGGA